MKKEGNFPERSARELRNRLGFIGNPDYCHKLTLSIRGGCEWLYEWTRVTPNLAGKD